MSPEAPEPPPPGKDGAPRASKERPERVPPERDMPAPALKTTRPESGAPERGSLHVSPSRRTMKGKRATRGPDRALQDLWVERLRAGDAEALREVIEAFSDRISAVVAGILRDRDAVDDVVQETFVKAFYRIGSFKGGSSLYTWLYRVAVNATKDYIKSRKRRPAGSLDDMPGTAASLPTRAAPQIEGLEQRERRLAVRAAIAELPRKFRTVLALREIDGLAYHEIAEVMDLSLGTVESRLFRARRRLQGLLARSKPGGHRPGDA